MEHQPLVGEKEQSPGIKDLLTVIFKHKKKIAAVFFAVVVAVTLVTLLLPPVYEAKSTLLIKIGREYLNHSELGENRLSVNQEEVNNSEIQILTNHDLIKRVITTLKLEKMYPDLAKNPPRSEEHTSEL